MFRFAQDGAFVSDEVENVNNFGPEWKGISIDAAGNFYIGGRGIAKTFPSLDEIGFVTPQEGEGRSATGLRIDPATRDLYVTLDTGAVSHFASSCNPGQSLNSKSGPCVPIETFGSGNLTDPKGVAVDDTSGVVYVADTGDHRVAAFTAEPYLPDASASAQPISPSSESLHGSADPAGAGTISACHFQFVTDVAFEETRFSDLSSGGSRSCDQTTPISGATPVSTTLTGLAYGTTYHFRLLLENGNGANASFDQTFDVLPRAPEVSAESVSEVSGEFAKVHALIDSGGGGTTYHTTYLVEYGETQSYGSQAPLVAADAGSDRGVRGVVTQLTGLTPNTTYHYRVVAANASGNEAGADRTFTTFPFIPKYEDECANAHVRQQTGAAGLLDCRAYELVSAADSAGYDVESNLVAGQTPFGSYPEADGHVLYGIHGGGVPGTNHPTNRGVDPYVATRGSDGWNTEYAGVPANNPFSAAPFSSRPSGASSNLDTLAFGGPESCSPCFEGGYTGIPVRLPSGKLVQGMVAAGNVPAPPPSAQPDGHIAKDLSADGEHLIFGSTSLFAQGGNGETGDVSIYDRNLKTGETHVISNQPGTGDLPNPLACLQGAGKCNSAAGDANGISELDISQDGSHILLGQKVSEDAEGNPYYHLYMEVNDSAASIDLTPGTTHGVLYDGMTADGAKVYFTSVDAFPAGVPQVISDTDQSADLYVAEVGPGDATLQLLSTGTEGTGNTDSCDPVANSAHLHWNTVDPEEESCSVVAIGGGGGVAAADGSVYFLSPEKLDGSSAGTQNAPNLYVVRPGGTPQFIATLESVLTGAHPPRLRHSFKSNFGSFGNATALAVEHEHGDVYVLDAAANAVERFDSAGNPVNFTKGPNPGTDRLTGDETSAGSFEELFFGFLPFPTQLAVDQTNGDLYVPDFNHSVVDEFKANGELESAFGTGGSVSVPLPSAVAFDPTNGDLYVSSFFGSVQVFDSSGSPVSEIPIEGLLSGLAVDSTGNLYVTYFSEEEGRTDVFSATGKFIKTLDPNPSQAVIVDPSNDDAYVDEGSQVARFDSTGTRVETLGSGSLVGSVGIALDPEGNLYATTEAGQKVAVFTSSLASDQLIDNPAVVDAVSHPETRHTADFQVTPDGGFAAFASTLALAGHEEETDGHAALYRYDASTTSLDCVSCSPAGVPSGGDSSLASNGLSLTADGRVFFNSSDQLSAADTDGLQDVYEWEPLGTGDCKSSSPSFGKAAGVCLALVSAGTSSFDSGLLGVSLDGTEALFFTRDSLAPQDENGQTMKIYDARVEGGFPYSFPAAACKASDECHGGSSAPPAPQQIGSESGAPHQYESKPSRCPRSKVPRRGRCVTKHHHKKHHKRGGSR